MSTENILRVQMESTSTATKITIETLDILSSSCIFSKSRTMSLRSIFIFGACLYLIYNKEKSDAKILNVTFLTAKRIFQKQIYIFFTFKDNTIIQNKKHSQKYRKHIFSTTSAQQNEKLYF